MDVGFGSGNCSLLRTLILKLRGFSPQANYADEVSANFSW
jgi:hypothetical protein